MPTISEHRLLLVGRQNARQRRNCVCVCVCGEAYSSSFCDRFYAVGSSGIGSKTFSAAKVQKIF